MKNGSRMIIMYENDRGRSKIKLYKRWQRQDWPRKVMLCVVGLKRNRLLTNCYRSVERLILTSTVNWKITLSNREKVNWKGVVFHHTVDPTYLWRSIKNWNLDGKFWCINLIVITLHHQTTICFDLYRTLLMV